jgi:hypothetical protein
MKMAVKMLLAFPVCFPLACAGMLGYAADHLCSYALDRINDWIEK